MDFHITIPENHPRHSELRKITENLLFFIDADSVYLSLTAGDLAAKTIITLFLKEGSSQDSDELCRVTEKVFRSYPQFPYRIFGVDWAAYCFRKGNPFLLLNCSRTELVYSAGEGSAIFNPANVNVKRLLKKAKRRYEKDSLETGAIRRDLSIYIRNKNELQAAYILQRIIRSLYYTASWFLTGESIPSQDIAEQQRYIRSFSDSLGTLFNTDKEDEALLLEQLDDVCHAVRYNHTIEIRDETIPAAKSKAEWLQKEVQRLFEEQIRLCEEKFAHCIEDGVDEAGRGAVIVTDSFTLRNELLQQVAAIIHGFIQMEGIYCFGHKTIAQDNSSVLFQDSDVHDEQHHFYLLVFVKKQIAGIAPELVRGIKEGTGGQVTVTLLLHKVAALRQAVGNQTHFFSQVMNNGQQVYLRSELLQIGSGAVQRLRMESRLAYMKQRQEVADYFLQHSERPAANAVIAFMLHQAVVQLCLGMIRVFLGYRPNHYSLVFLFELCEHFSPLTAEIFPRRSEEERRLFKILNTELYVLRGGFVDGVSDLDIEVLRGRCVAFGVRVEEIVKEREVLFL